MEMIVITELKEMDEQHREELSNLLIKVVEEGASVGFLPPIDLSVAKDYWRNLLCPEVHLFVTKLDGEIVGSIQLHLSTKENGLHRAEIAKLMAHPDVRRKGIGRALIHKAEEQAKKEDRTLIVLDTREGDPSNQLYRSLGYIQAGRVPNYAKSASGELEATIIYYKELD
ncbi:GNAT family N-acetyltransferase [Cytobacillus sp. FJAT-54145]|uniref:GNAT family N-acetyltransferase n=1 Tax=Cytobacillus spartinae TaxID=3299023 RepID=A0ABW6K7I3_9BACI